MTGLFRKLFWESAVNRWIAAYLGAVALATALVLASVYATSTRVVEAEMRAAVEAELRGFQDDLRLLGVFGLASAVNRRAADGRDGDGVYLLVSRNGARIAGNLSAWPDSLGAAEGWTALQARRVDRRASAAAVAFAATLPGGERLLVGREAAGLRVFEGALRTAMLSAVAVLAALTVAAGSLLSRALRRRLDALGATAEQIASGDLDQRAPRSAAGDEFDRLADRLNAMLARISELVGDLRLVTDSVSHDLRSPLTRLRGHLDAALAIEADPAARARIEAALGEADMALTAFSGLIAIARAEAGVGRDQFERVDVAQMVRELAELFGPAAQEAGLRLSVETPAVLTAQAHRQLLAQAISNLLDNALRHGPRGGEVRLLVDMARDAGGAAAQARVRVIDDGPGVPAADRERALKRFVQLRAQEAGGEAGGEALGEAGRLTSAIDQSGPHMGQGSGLGLALVSAVAKLHGGGVRLSDARPGEQPPGLEARLQWPLDAVRRAPADVVRPEMEREPHPAAAPGAGPH